MIVFLLLCINFLVAVSVGIIVDRQEKTIRELKLIEQILRREERRQTAKR